MLANTWTELLKQMKGMMGINFTKKKDMYKTHDENDTMLITKKS